jgi:L-threonylcarbamoyladenylate synthase
VAATAATTALDFRHWSEHLAKGGVLAYPTETVWGLGADIRFPEAIQRIYELKGRPQERATSILVSGIEMARSYAEVTPELETMLRIFWPGPLTIVLPAKNTVPGGIQAQDGTVGLRCSSHPWSYSMLITHRYPITTTSANLSGEPPAKSAQELTWLPESVERVSWRGNKDELEIGKPSTVLKPQGSPGQYQVLREGALPKDHIIHCLQTVGISIHIA